MIAYGCTRNDIIISYELLADKHIDAFASSLGQDSKEEEDFEIGAIKQAKARMVGADSSDGYLDSDEGEETYEEDSNHHRAEVNIASIYLKEINKVPLLSRKREIQLAKTIQEGERKIRNLILQSPAEVQELLRIHQGSRRGKLENRSIEEIVHRAIRKLLKMAQSAGEEKDRVMDLVRELRKAEAPVKVAKAEMIQSNLRLVVSITKIYVNRGLSFLDLIQEGNMGLMKAVSKYDYTKGFKFSTYASWWIRQAITRALADKSRTIRIPNHLLETRSKTIKAFHHLVKDLGREPLPEEIAQKAEIPLGNVLRVMSLIQEPVSLETPVGDDGSKLQDLVGSEESLSFNDDLIENMDVEKKARDLLSLLGPREEQILRLRFGIGTPSGYTLEEIGKRFGISRERVRQIEERALKKLKFPAESTTQRAETA